MDAEREIPVLVSACLLGRSCRYDGGSNPDGDLMRELERAGNRPVPFCPEEAGGLPTPRPAAWIQCRDARAVLDGADRVVTEGGADATEAFLRGAEGALATCRAENISLAYLKERSPSCGVSHTHVGGKLTPGHGVTAELLERNGIQVEGVEGRRP